MHEFSLKVAKDERAYALFKHYINGESSLPPIDEGGFQKSNQKMADDGSKISDSPQNSTWRSSSITVETVETSTGNLSANTAYLTQKMGMGCFGGVNVSTDPGRTEAFRLWIIPRPPGYCDGRLEQGT